MVSRRYSTTSSAAFRHRAQTCGFAITTVGMAAAIAQISSNTLPVAITLGTPALFGLLAVGSQFLSGELIGRVWAAIGFFGALVVLVGCACIWGPFILVPQEKQPLMLQNRTLQRRARGALARARTEVQPEHPSASAAPQPPSKGESGGVHPRLV